MSNQIITSDLIVDLSTEEQQFLSGGYDAEIYDYYADGYEYFGCDYLGFTPYEEEV